MDRKHRAWLSWLALGRGRYRAVAKAIARRADVIFRNRDFIIRTDGKVRFLHISIRAQKIAASAVLAVLVGALYVLVNTILAQLSIERGRLQVAEQRAEVGEKQAAVSQSTQEMEKYRDQIGATMVDIEARQALLEDILAKHFDISDSKPNSTASNSEIQSADSTAADNIAGEASKAATRKQLAVEELSVGDVTNPSYARELLRRLQAKKDEQQRFADRLLSAINKRADEAAAAVKKLGLNPRTLLRNAARGQGGAFVPYSYRNRLGQQIAVDSDLFAPIERALFRMDVLERTLVALPFDNPARYGISSRFGYRRDPFTGAPAMHTGIDFRGRHGSAIVAAAAGRVSYVGYKPGYGKTIEINHGQGIMTRYAHLSGYTARKGQHVAAGDSIGRMGSTGRSTASHLHFEVRQNGVALNPLRFLEVNDDVLKIKAVVVSARNDETQSLRTGTESNR